MKHIKLFWFVVMMMVLSIGVLACTENDADRLANKIAAVHATIKAVITDTSVMSQIPDDTMKKLIALENKYQDARQKYESSKMTSLENRWSILKEMTSYGFALVSIIKTLPYVNQYSAEIAVAQVTIEALVNLFG